MTRMERGKGQKLLEMLLVSKVLTFLNSSEKPKSRDRALSLEASVIGMVSLQRVRFLLNFTKILLVDLMVTKRRLCCILKT